MVDGGEVMIYFLHAGTPWGALKPRSRQKVPQLNSARRAQRPDSSQALPSRPARGAKEKTVIIMYNPCDLYNPCDPYNNKSGSPHDLSKSIP